MSWIWCLPALSLSVLTVHHWQRGLPPVFLGVKAPQTKLLLLPLQGSCSGSSPWLGRKEGNVLINDALISFYLWLYGIIHMVKDHSDSERENPLPPHGLLQLAARALLYAPSHRQDSTYHGLCYTSRGALAGMRNSSMGPPWRIDLTTNHTMSECSYHGAISR